MPLQDEVRQRLTVAIEKMPSLPTTVGKVIELANDLKSSAKDILAVIQMDPVLTAKVLKLINSAFFALPNKVSLKQAIVLLGVNTIKNLALSSAIIGQMDKGRSTLKDFDQFRFWQHSLGTAIAARLLARRIGIDQLQQDEYFVAGLVHDIGKLVLAQALPLQFVRTIQLAQSRRVPSWQAEREVLGIDHSEVGALLARKWSLSENLEGSVCFHHQPREQQSRLTWVTHLANHQVNLQGYSSYLEADQAVLDEQALPALGIAPAELEPILAGLPQELENASIFLQSDKVQ